MTLSIPYFLYERHDKHPYPRSGLRLYPLTKRRGEGELLQDREEVQRFCSFGKDVFLNLFSEDQKKSKVYDCIFLDIDSESFRKSFTMLQAVVDKLRNVGVDRFHIVFSGAKGFHVYVPFKPLLLHNYRVAVLDWARSIGVLKLIDIKSVEPNRVSRIPTFENTKSGRICKYIGSDQCVDYLKLNDVLNQTEVEMGEVEYNVMPELRKYDKPNRESESMDYKIGKSAAFSKERYYPDCMLDLLYEARAGTDLNHHSRLELGKFLLHVHGGDTKRVRKEYEKMSDYAPDKTQYQLDYIMRRELKSAGCDKLIDDEICPHMTKQGAQAKCPFYPSLNPYMKLT